eukprot:8328828-Pyramimonas_sp.AAC.1
MPRRTNRHAQERAHGSPTVGARPQETPHKKPHLETPGRPPISGAGASRSPWRSHRSPRNPGHPGSKQGASWHGSRLCEPRAGIGTLPGEHSEPG